MKAYTVLGTTDEFTTCDLCGRADLRATVALQPADGSEPVHFGADCAARATGWSVVDVESRARMADSKREEAERLAASAAREVEFAAWETWLAEATGMTDVTAAIAALGGFATARALYRDAQADR